MSNSFDYAVIRIVPAVEREEFFNAGVILFCPGKRYLNTLTALDHSRLKAFAPDLSASAIQPRLDAIHRICEGDPGGGPIAHLTQRARFHWLIAPRSTIVQMSAAHSGLCDDPAQVLDRLFREQVGSKIPDIEHKADC